MNALRQGWALLMVLLGVAGLLIKHWLSGSVGELAHSYFGNLAVSFAVYFLVSFAARQRLNRVVIALIALLAVESFELADGFGIMANVYDPLDLLANALGVLLAYCVDMASTRIIPPDSGGR
jgi:glycopeptide antibiotics resistance protein